MARRPPRKIEQIKRIENLRKRRGKYILVICEGAKTEIIYFTDMKEYIGRNANVCVKPMNKSGADALKLVEYAINQAANYLIDYKADEQVWCVIDVDDKTDEQLRVAYEKARKNNINIALSNPSFEIWYLLHFCCSTGHLSNEQLIDRLKKHLPRYSKNQSVFKQVYDHTENAIKNARQLIVYHKGNGANIYGRDGNPSTWVFELMDNINRLK